MYVEITGNNTGNQESAFPHFRPDPETERSNTHIVRCDEASVTRDHHPTGPAFSQQVYGMEIYWRRDTIQNNQDI
jgi:hypothetical protein